MAPAILDLLQRELAPPDGEASISHRMLVLTVPPVEVLRIARRMASEFRFDLPPPGIRRAAATGFAASVKVAAMVHPSL